MNRNSRKCVGHVTPWRDGHVVQANVGRRLKGKEHHPGKCRWNYITGKVAGSNPVIAGGNPCGVAQRREHSPLRFITPLLPETSIDLANAEGTTLQHQRDHPRRFDSSPCRRPDGKPLVRKWGRDPTCFFSLVARSRTSLANAGGTTVSRVRTPPLISLLRVAQLVEHETFHQTLVARAETTPANAGWNYIVNVEVVGSSPTPAAMAG